STASDIKHIKTKGKIKMAEEMRTCKACGGTKPLEKGFNAVPRKEGGGSIITNRAKPAATRQSGKSARKNARRREPAR
ncbi:TPA: hypothetical protein ACKN4W_001449, partial [Neisseria gonorrhoeae]